MLRLIEKGNAKKPFYHETIGIHLYTMEELCYFLETHTYLIDPIWVGEPLFAWIESELGEEKLAQQLRLARRRQQDEYTCVEIILNASGFYSETEIEAVAERLNQMRGKTKIERRKMCGDLFLADGKYRQAAYTYMELLEDRYVTHMTEELRGNICHNLGIVYVHMFLFEEAAKLFSEAYELRKTAASRDAYLFASNFSEDEGPIDEKRLGLNFNVMREVLDQLNAVSDDPAYFIERKKAMAAAEAVDWKGAQNDLIREWFSDYRAMI